MKILILGSKEYPFGAATPAEDPNPSGGIEIYVENLVKNLDKTLNLIIITRKFRNTKTYERKNNIEVYRLPFIKGFYLRNPSFNFLSFLRSLSLDFDVIISHDDIASFLGLLLSKIKRKPIIMVCHGLPSEQPQYNPFIRFLFKFIEKITYTHSSANITHSPQQLKKITKKYEVVFPGFDKNRIRLIYKKERDKLKNEYKIGNRKVIVYVGRLIKVKGIEYLLEALSYIKYPYICFIVGYGPQALEYKELAKKRHLNTIFTGFRKDVDKFLSIADVFVLPSLSESLNYSLLEAVSLEVPVVVTDLGIIPEDAAIVVEKKDSKAIGEAINKLFKDKSLAKSLSLKSKKFIDKFNWNKAAEKYLDVIRKVL